MRVVDDDNSFFGVIPSTWSKYGWKKDFHSLSACQRSIVLIVSNHHARVSDL